MLDRVKYSKSHFQESRGLKGFLLLLSLWLRKIPNIVFKVEVVKDNFFSNGGQK